MYEGVLRRREGEVHEGGWERGRCMREDGRGGGA